MTTSLQTWRLDTPSQTVVVASFGDAPRVVYWAAPLPTTEDLQTIARMTVPDVGGSMLDVETPISLSPEVSRGFPGHPGLIAREADGKSIRLTLQDLKATQSDQELILWAGGQGLKLFWQFTVLKDSNVIALQTRLKADRPVLVDWLSTPVLPVAPHLSQLTDVSGRWRDEFQLNTQDWRPGLHVRENRTGRTDHAHFPGVIVSTNTTQNTSGEVLAAQYAWSGGHRMVAEHLQDGRRHLQFGHMPDDVREPVTDLSTALLYVTYGVTGLNHVARSSQHLTRHHVINFPDPDRPRPVHYNCWEAVYFDHTIADLKDIAGRAAHIGAERFVLDDGWFGNRDDDTTSLGDWTVDPRKYPDGLTPLIDHVHSVGMTFGLWVEPEMVNPESDLYRQHPQWLLGPSTQATARHQWVLDLSQKAVQEHLYWRLTELLSAYEIEYLKWDHNRVLPLHMAAQTEGLYALLDSLRAAFPHVEIESCASGGGRIDLGILARTHRVWLSDSNDALERLRMQHDAALFLPNEVVGSHIGPRHCHTTHRTFDIGLRAWTAAQRHMGFEADPRELTAEECEITQQVIAWYKANRDWLRTATTLRLDIPDPAYLGEVQVSADGTRFVAFIAHMTTAKWTQPQPIRLTGLNPNRTYSLTARANQDTPSWALKTTALQNDPTRSTVTTSGQSLMSLGLTLPQSFPATVWVIEGHVA